MQIKQFLPALLVLVLAACGPSGGQGHGGMPPAQVSVITVEPKSLPANFEYTGPDARLARSRSARARHRHPAGAQFHRRRPGREGPVAVHHRPGAVRAAAARAEADVAGAEARLAQAKKNAARLKPLYAEKAVSQKEFDDATSAEAIADADLKAARRA